MDSLVRVDLTASDAKNKFLAVDERTTAPKLLRRVPATRRGTDYDLVN